MKFINLIFTAIGGVVVGLMNPQAPAGREGLYALNSLLPNAIPEPSILLDLFWKGYLTLEETQKYLINYGFDGTTALKLVQAAENVIPVADGIRLYRRGEIDKTRLESVARANRVPPDQLEHYLKATEYFPSPSDLIRFAVREVYTPDTAEAFGLFEDLPAKFIEESGKVGLPVEQARNFWAAHWELPSPLQGFEMYHRGIIDTDTLKLLLKSLDVMPFWRDRMIQLSYNPLTRVDVRRMYGMGVLDEKGVYQSYLNIGYSPENARLMTEFTKRYENDGTDGITRANVVSAYKKDLITRDELDQFLDDFGYTPEVKAFWIENAEYEKVLEEVDAITADLIERYQLGAISEDDMRKMLLSNDLPSSYVEKVIHDVLRDQAKRIKLPSKEDLTSWLKKKLIDEEVYYANMRKLGYTDTTIQFYISEIAIEQDTTDIVFLKEDIYLRWFKAGIMSEDDLRRTLSRKGISEEDINNLIMEVVPPSA